MNKETFLFFSHKSPSLILKATVLVFIFLGLFALWRWSPLKEWASAENIKNIAVQISDQPLAPIIFIVSYSIGAITFFPRPLITMAAVIAFGARQGFIYAMLGIISSAIISYAIGRKANKEMINRVARNKMDKVISKLKKANFLIIGAIRLVPIAPFIVINLIAGAIHIRLGHFIGGTILGVLPGTLMTTVFANQVAHYLAGSGELSYLTMTLVALMWLGIATGIKIWWAKQS